MTTPWLRTSHIVYGMFCTIVIIAVAAAYMMTHAAEKSLLSELKSRRQQLTQHHQNLRVIRSHTPPDGPQTEFIWQLSQWVDELGLTLTLQPLNNTKFTYSVVVTGAAAKLRQLLLLTSEQSLKGVWKRALPSQFISFSETPGQDGRLNWQLTRTNQEQALEPIMANLSITEVSCPEAPVTQQQAELNLADLRLAATVTSKHAASFAYWQSDTGVYIKTTVGQRFYNPTSVITTIADEHVELDQLLPTEDCNVTTKKIIQL